MGNLGIAYKCLGQYEKAIEHSSQALADFDVIWADLKTDEDRITFADRPYMMCSWVMQKAHVALGQPELALEVSDTVAKVTTLQGTELFKRSTRGFLREVHGAPINGILNFMNPQKCLQTLILINFDLLWAWQNLWGYCRMILTKL